MEKILVLLSDQLKSLMEYPRVLSHQTESLSCEHIKHTHIYMMTNMPSELWWLWQWQWQKQLDLLSTAMDGVEITGIPDNTVDETIWTGITNNNYLDWIHVTDRCDIYLQHFQHFAYIHTQSETKTFLREEKRFSRNLWKLSWGKWGHPSSLSFEQFKKMPIQQSRIFISATFSILRWSFSVKFD